MSAAPLLLPPPPHCTTRHRAGAPLHAFSPLEGHRLLRALIDEATPGERVSGERWYLDAGKRLATAAAAAGHDPRMGAAVAACLSPRAPWAVNEAAALLLLLDPTARPAGCVLPERVKLAQALLAAPGDARAVRRAVSTPKVHAFMSNLLAGAGIGGDAEAVTVDVWALRAVGLDDPARLGRCGCGHAAVAQAYRLLATDLQVSASAAQALAWVVVRRRAGVSD